MKVEHINWRWLSISLIILLMGCDTNYSDYKINSAPEFDQEYYDKVLNLLNEKIESNPDGSANYFKKAELLYEMDKVNSALLSLNQAIYLEKQDPDYYLLQAQLLAEKGEMNAAIAAAERAEQLSETSASFFSMMGTVLLKTGNFELAKSYLQQAVRKDPNNAGNFYQLGLVFLNESDTARAIELIKQGINMNPEPDMFQTMYQLSMAQNKLDSAEHYLSLNLQMNPNDPDLLFERALLLKREALLDSAQQIFRYLLNLDGNGVKYLYQLAITHFGARNFDSASYYANKILDLQESKEAFLILARVSNRRYDLNEAADFYRKALAVDSTYSEAREELSEVNGKIAYRNRLRQEKERRTSPAEVENLNTIPQLSP